MKVWLIRGKRQHSRWDRGFCHNQKGMTMMEIIIVIGMIGILAGGSVLYLGHVRAANTKKAAEVVDTALNKLQVRTMSKAGTPYLYIYHLSDGCYMKVLEEKLTSFDNTKLDTDSTKLGSDSISVYMDSETGTQVSGDNFIRIVYTKASGFGNDTTVSAIVLKGNTTVTIRLRKDTGKHVIE